MKAIRIPIFVLAALLAFSVCNAVHLTRRCHTWQAEVMAADRAAAAGHPEEASAALASSPIKTAETRRPLRWSARTSAAASSTPALPP